MTMDEEGAIDPVSDSAPNAETRKITASQMHGLLAAGGSGVTRELRGWQPPSVEDLQRTLPQYEVTSFLARGGMGAVYKGVQKTLHRIVAIKVLPPESNADEDLNFAARFKQEARAMAALSHPNIVAVHEAGEVEMGRALGPPSAASDDGGLRTARPTLLYFVMEFVEGTDVARLVASEGRIDPPRALDITRQVCEALAFAHESGIVHRDIKPSNIMLDKKGRVKVADFGLAKMAPPEGTSAITQTGTAMGTADYVAPEVLIYGMTVDQRADLYAVGVMLYQMLTGQVPRGRFALPSVLVPGLDPRLDAIVDKAMQTDREQRYSTATDLKSDVEAVAARADHRLATAATKSRAPLLFGLITAALILALGAFFALKKAGDGMADGPPSAPVSPSPSLRVSASSSIVPIPGLPDLPPLAIPPGEPGLVKEFEVKGGFLTGIGLLPDSRRLLVFPGGSTALIDLETETPIWSISGGATDSSAVNQDGSRFVTYDIQGLDGKHAMPLSGQQALIRLHSTSTGRLIQSWTVPITPMSAAYRQVALSPSGKRIVARTGGNDEAGKQRLDAQFVALEEGKETPVMQWTATGHHHGHVTFALDEDRYLSTGNGAPVLMSFAKPGETTALMGDMATLRSGLSADKRRLVASEGKNLAVWNLASGKREFYLERGIADPPNLLFAGDGLILSKPESQTPVADLNVWDGTTGKLLAKLANAKPDETFSDLLAGAANGTFCVARVKHNPAPKSGDGNTLQIWRLPKPGQVHASAAATGGAAAPKPPSDGALGPSALPGAATPAKPARPWVKVNFVGMSTLNAGKLSAITAEEIKTNGGLKLMNNDLWLSGVVPSMGKVQNGAIRVRFIRTAERDTSGASFDIGLRGVGIGVIPAHTEVVVNCGPKTDPASRLPNLPMGIAQPLGQEMELEIGCVGKLLVVKRDGTLIGTSKLPVLDAAGDFRLSGSEVIITSAELLNLDGLPEAEALKVLGVDASTVSASPSLPVSKSPATTEPWVNALADKSKLYFSEAEITITPQGLRFPVRGRVLFNCGPELAPSRDGAVRMVATYAAAKKGPYIYARIPDKSAPLYRLGIITSNKAALEWWDTDSQSSQLISEFSLLTPLQPDQDYELELRSIGTKLTAKFNGQLLGEAEDSTIVEGKFGVANMEDTPTLIKALGYLNLDGLPEAEALKMLGVDAAGGRADGPPSAAAPPQTGALGQSALPASATKDAPFVNTLGMKFVPVPGTEVLFCNHETRKQDYAAYAAANPGIDMGWKNAMHADTPVSHEDDHPVISVSWQDATDFCAWLSKREGRTYRLPTDREWSFAVGIGEQDSTEPEVKDRSQKVQGEYPWGSQWPPPARAANLADESFLETFPGDSIIEGYSDGFPTTAPVMSFEPNKLGIHDLGGNVWEWCEDRNSKTQENRVGRGGAYDSNDVIHLLSSYRVHNPPDFRFRLWGFRIVVEK